MARGKESTNKTRDEMISGRGHSFIIIIAFNVRCKLILDSKYLLNVETERCRSCYHDDVAGRVRDQQRAGGPGIRQEESQEFQNGESRLSRQWSQQTSNMSRYIRAVNGASRNFTMPSAQVSGVIA